MKSKTLFLPLAVSLIASSAAHAAFTLTATEDNNVKRGLTDNPESNGSGGNLSLKEATDGQTNARIGFIKFDLTGQTSTLGHENAVFTATIGNTATANFTLKAFVLNSGETFFDWTESTIKWDNRPAPGGAADNFVDPLKALTLTAIGSPVIADTSLAGTSVSFNFADWANYVQADDSLTIILLTTNQTDPNPSLSIATSENTTVAYRPKLVSVPEPSSAALLLLGSVALLRRKVAR